MPGTILGSPRSQSPFMRSLTIPKSPRATTSRTLHQRRTLTVTEVAALLGISRSTAYECVHRGEIPSRRFGRRIVVLRHELDALLNHGTVEATHREA